MRAAGGGGIRVKIVLPADLEDAITVPHVLDIAEAPAGNRLWRSPEAYVEGQLNWPTNMFSFGIVACPPYYSQPPFLRCKILILPPDASTPPRACCKVFLILQRKFVADVKWNPTDRRRDRVTGWGMDGVLGSDDDFIDLVVGMSDFYPKGRMAAGRLWSTSVLLTRRGEKGVL